MKTTTIAAFLLLASFSSFAKTTCKDVIKAEQLDEAGLKKKAEGLGYTVTKSKPKGNCFEMYATNKAGKKVEVYFNLDGTVNKEEMD